MASKTKAAPKVLSKATAKELSSKMVTSITIQNSVHLSNRKTPCGIKFYEDEVQFFDPTANEIHLGIYGPLAIFGVTTEEDYVAGLQYFFGHENQHVRSTASVPYDNGVKRAVHSIIEYIAAKEGIRKNFRNERDYEVFVQQELPAKGIHVSFNTLMQICARLMNSVEDGRIERIRSLEFKGFEKQRRYFRAIVWNQDVEYKPYSEGLDDLDKLNLFCNNILSLATTGLYLKGFLVEYGGTEIVDEMKKFMPYIAKGVLATRTRVMADNVVEIAKLLAPYIYTASKYDPRKFDEAMKKMLEQMLKQLISEMAAGAMAPTSEREEEQDEGIPSSVFPMSELVITLDDETYDKLMEKAKKSGQSGGGIMVRREHPKDEENKDGKQEGSGSGSSDGKDGEEQKDGKGGSGKHSDKEGEKNGQGSSGQGGEQPGQQCDSQSQNGQQSGNQSGQQSGQSGQNGQQSNGQSSNSQSSENSGNEPYSKEYSRSEGGSCKEGGNAGSHQSGGGEGGSLEMVMEQMQQAAKDCRDAAEETISNINQAIERTAKTNRGNAPIVQNHDKPVTASDVKDICSRGFEEVQRKYQLDQHLPPMLHARARSFRKKNERYFKSLSTPNVTNLDSGCIDPSLIYGLSFGETNIFRRVGIDKQFDGCVYLLLDNSGSMAGNKRIEAAKAAAVIEEGFKGIIPIKIVAFDTCGPIIHEVIKGWEESQRLNCCWNFATHGRSGCGNDDGKDILIAQRELLNRPEEKKLLIVLSDGAPSSIEETKRAIDDTRKKGIGVYGIYFEEGRIGSDAKEFQYMYQKDYVCCELSEVDTELTKLMIKFSRS